MKCDDVIRIKWLRAVLLGLCLFLSTKAAFAQKEMAILEGKVVDVNDKAVVGAEVYVYDTDKVRRPGDFVSNKTLADGRYRVMAPPGQYWVVARWRKSGASLGPLTPEDKHSGEPEQIDLSPGANVTIDFKVANLVEVSLETTKKRPDLVRLQGRILDKQGRPVSMAYAMASSREVLVDVPEYISAWTNAQGEFILYVPSGDSFFIGAGTGFPPEKGCTLSRKVAPNGNEIDMDIVLSCGKK